MHYSYVFLLMACFILTNTGCSKEEKVIKSDSKSETTESKTPTIEGAKVHLQKYIDRLLGGDETVKVGLLGFEGTDFSSFDSIEIVSAQQKFLDSGEKVDGMFSLRVRVTGKNDRTGRSIEKIIAREVMNSGYGYQILGADF